MTELALRDVALPPAEIVHPADAELELRRHQALLDVLRRGRAELREQVVVLRRCVEYAVRGADLVDELRDAGQLAEHGGDRATPEARGLLTLERLGLNDRRVSEWRSLRDHGAIAFLDQALADERAVTLERASLNWLRQRVERIAREEQAADADPEPAYDHELRHGDLRTALDDLAGTVDAIITDPPYGAAWLDEYDALGELAARLLTPTGLLVVMVGQANLPRYLERLEPHLAYRWTGAYLTDGPATRVHGASVGTRWKPLLLFDRGARGRRFLTVDTFESAGADAETADRQLDGWSQSETGMADVVAHLTRPGELVVDPFLGAGTTGLACRELGRRFVGCDSDPDAIAAARRRLA
jgi:DNA methylase